MPKKSSYMKIDDGLEGVDDFLDEPNPFDDPNVAKSNGTAGNKIENDEHASINKGKADIVSLPPAYDDTIHLGNNKSYTVAPEGSMDNQGEIFSNDNNNNDYDYDDLEDRDKLPAGFLNYYSRYFEISTETFKRKMVESLKLNGIIHLDNLNNEKENSELYGAVWVTISVILIKFISPTLINLIYDNIIMGRLVTMDEKYNRNDVYFQLLHSVWLFGIYTFVTPLIMLQMLKNREPSMINPISLNAIKMISNYGYSNVNWLITIPFLDLLNKVQQFKIISLFKLIILILTGIKSYYFIINQIRAKELPIKDAIVSTFSVAIGIFHVAFCLLLFIMLY